jgi:N-acetyltransferase
LTASPPSRLESISKLNSNRSAGVIAPLTTTNALPNSSSDHSSGGSVHRNIQSDNNINSSNSNNSSNNNSGKKRPATVAVVVKKRILVDENDNEENHVAYSNKSLLKQRVTVVLDADAADADDGAKADAADASDELEDDSGEGRAGRTVRKFKQFGSRAATAKMPLFHATLDSPTEPHSPVGDSAALATAPSSANNQRSSTAAWKALLSGSEFATADDGGAAGDDDESFGSFARRPNANATPPATRKMRRNAAASGGGGGGEMASALDSTASGATKQTQMYLDFGQKNFTSVTCADCGLVYAPGHPEDEATHKKAHAKVVNEALSIGKRWRSQATLSELVVRTYADRDESLLAVRHGARAAEKMAAVRRVMDSALGYASDAASAGVGESRELLYVLVTAQGDVLGCCVVYPIAEAFMIDADATVSGAVEVSKERFVGGSVRMGVSRIWVRPQHRRRGVARRMLDGARATFDYAGAIDIDEIAFTQPTPDGHALLKAYVGSGRPLLVCK